MTEPSAPGLTLRFANLEDVDAVASLHASRISEVKDYMESSRESYGMQSFDQALAELVTTKQISFAAAMAAASKPADFELKLRMFGGDAAANMHEHDTDPGTPIVEAPAGAGAAAPVGLDFIQQ